MRAEKSRRFDAEAEVSPEDPNGEGHRLAVKPFVRTASRWSAALRRSGRHPSLDARVPPELWLIDSTALGRGDMEAIVVETRRMNSHAWIMAVSITTVRSASVVRGKQALELLWKVKS